MPCKVLNYQIEHTQGKVKTAKWYYLLSLLPDLLLCVQGLSCSCSQEASACMDFSIFIWLICESKPSLPPLSSFCQVFANGIEKVNDTANMKFTTDNFKHLFCEIIITSFLPYISSCQTYHILFFLLFKFMASFFTNFC